MYITGAGKTLDTAAPLAAFSYHTVPHWDLTVRLNASDGDATVTLQRNGSPISGSNNLFSHIIGGSYTLTVTKGDLIKYTKDFDLTSDLTLEVPTLVAKGNVNGTTDAEGEVSVLDMACLFTWLSKETNEGQIADESYFNRVCDVNDDGTVNILNYQALYMLVK